MVRSEGSQDKLQPGSALTPLTGSASTTLWFPLKGDRFAHKHHHSVPRRGARASLGFGTLLPGRASDWQRQGGRGPKWISSPSVVQQTSLESRPGQDTEAAAQGSCQPVFTKHHRPLPSAPASSSSPAERSSLGQEEGLAQARAVLLPQGSRPHPTICPGVECDPTWKKMDGTVSTEEHLGKIQDAYSET